ncbi:MAG: glycine oxidase ThiO [Bryobacteraceae bacterium]
MSQADSRHSELSIAIAGGGIIGLSIAWRLAQFGWQVTVFEKGSLGGESSWAGAGMVSPGGEIDAPSPLASLAIESRQLYGSFVHELQQISGFKVDYQECGALELAYSPDEAEGVENRAAQQASLGIPSKPLTNSQISSFWPRVQQQNLAAARFYPGDAIVNPRDLVAALADACRKSGVRISQDCPVFQVEVESDSVTLQTAQGTSRHAAAVVAAGAWSSSIHVKGTPPVPLAEPVKGHLIGYRQPEHTCHTILRHGHTYLLQRANGLLIAGASIERAGFNREIQPGIVNSLCRSAEAVLPHLSAFAPSETWIGFRPASDVLHVEAWHSSHLYLAYGHYRNGILLAPVTAERIGAVVNASLGTP